MDNTEGAIKNGQSRETGNIWYTRREQTKQIHKKHNHVKKTRASPQRTGFKYEPNIFVEIVTEILVSWC